MTPASKQPKQGKGRKVKFRVGQVVRDHVTGIYFKIDHIEKLKSGNAKVYQDSDNWVFDYAVSPLTKREACQ